jgi:hypothetical protein
MFKKTLSQEVNDYLSHKEFVTMKELRKMRDELLINSDWTQLPDIIVDNPTEWLEYRQNLRDFPDLIYQEELATGQRVENLDWPKEPEK